MSLMATARACVLVGIALTMCSRALAISWPLPYERVESRPPNNPYCQALYPFCPGHTAIPVLDGDDEVEVFLLKAPVWEFKWGDLLGKFNVYHDAMGFRSRKTGANYTLEWYELHQLLNCTFPHVVAGDDGTRRPLWCNQGAACFAQGIDDNHWIENGTLAMVSVIAGAAFNDFATWARTDNDTGVYYETWTVENPATQQRYFDSYDCASFVQRAVGVLHTLGAVFDKSFTPKYTSIVLYAAEEPQLYWNGSLPASGVSAEDLPKLAELVSFYERFDAHQSLAHLLLSLLELAAVDILLEHKFYFYYNSMYFNLRLQRPFVSIRYDAIPLP
eukprot:Opistho-2@71440